MKPILRSRKSSVLNHPKSLVILVCIAQVISGCAFKTDQAQSNGTNAGINAQKKMAFRPKDLNIRDGETVLSVIDSITLPKGDYQIDQTVTAKGVVEYPYLAPQFHETDCTGLGYTISYEPQRRGITSAMKLKVYVNGNLSLLDHIVASPADNVQLAVYADYAPIAEFVDKGVLPNEFVKGFEPSGKCTVMCSAITLPAARPLLEPPGGTNCFSWIPRNGPNNMPNDLRTTDFIFYPSNFEIPQMRAYYIKLVQDCDAVWSNADLRAYYDGAATGVCRETARKVLMREWMFVEQKVPYFVPVYTISNLSEVIKDTAKTQTEYLKDMPVHPTSDWL